MSRDSKMDLHGARTVEDLERRYNFGTSFAEAMGIATDARSRADSASASVNALNSKVNNLFTENINMTGKLTNTVEVFIEPSDPEILTIQCHISGIQTIPDDLIPMYDFDNDGVVTDKDLAMAGNAKLGIQSLASWSGAVLTPITLSIDLSDLEKAIQISGKNMWGRDISEYIGYNGTTIKHIGTEDYVMAQGTRTCISELGSSIKWTYRRWDSGIMECWCKCYVLPSATGDISESVPYPFDFATEPNVTVSEGLRSANYTRLRYGNAYGSDPSNKAKVSITFEGVKTAGKNLYAYIQVIGRWK